MLSNRSSSNKSQYFSTLTSLCPLGRQGTPSGSNDATCVIPSSVQFQPPPWNQLSALWCSHSTRHTTVWRTKHARTRRPRGGLTQQRQQLVCKTWGVHGNTMERKGRRAGVGKRRGSTGYLPSHTSGRGAITPRSGGSCSASSGCVVSDQTWEDCAGLRHSVTSSTTSLPVPLA